MKQVELQIWNRLQEAFVAVDIDRSTQFPFVLESSDIQDPTAIKVEWSKQVNLPMTKLNNHLFSQIWKMDSLIYNFDPLLRTDFRLYINGDLFQSGYIKLESITHVYNVRLFGGLAEYFYMLSERKLKDMEWNNKFNHKIDKELIYNAWNGNSFNNALKPGQDMSSYFGYAMTYQGNYENFDENSVLISGEKKGVTWIDTNKTGDPYEKPALNEHKRTFEIDTTKYYGEYRSYYQKPMIRVKTILEKIFSDIKTEGWNTELDKSFFNSKNPYYNDLWIICPQYNISDASITEFGEFNEGKNPVITVLDRSEAAYHPISFVRSEGQTEDLRIIDIDRLDFTDEHRKLFVKIRVPFRIKCYPNGEDGYNRHYKFTTDSDCEHTKKMTVHIRGVKNGNPNNPDNIILFQNPETGEDYYDMSCYTIHAYHPWYEKYLRPEGATYEGEKDDNLKGGSGTIFYLEANFPYDANAGYDMQLEACVQFYNSNHYSTGLYRTGDKKGNYDHFIFEFELVQEAQSIEIFAPQDLRTNSLITWTDIMRSEYTYFDFLTSYSKVFGLLFTKNKYNKTVTIQTRNSFFAAQQKVNWTDKLDHSKEKIITPLGFDYKIGEFKWAALNTKYEEDYLNRNARHYGSMRFNNGYYYTNEEKNFLEGNIFSNCIIATDYSQYYLRRDDDFPLKDNKTLPFLQDASESAVDTNLCLVFFNGYKQVSSGYPFLITDDNGKMSEDGYFWNTILEERKPSYKYPNLTRYFQTYDETAQNTIISSLNFGRPSLIYNDDEYQYMSDNDTDGAETIYSKFWKAYLQDRFDRNCKILTAYFHLTLDDINSDLLSKFIYINDSVWVINKIIDFNPLSNQPTKVELIKVQNPDNYLGQNYIEGIFKMYYPQNNLLHSKGNIITIQEPFTKHDFTVYIDSTLDWEIKDDNDLSIQPMIGIGTDTNPNAAKTPVKISLLEHTYDEYTPSAEHKYYYLPFQWGSRVTMLEIKQNYGWLINLIGKDGQISVNNSALSQKIDTYIQNGSEMNLTTGSSAPYSFIYWKINDNYYFDSKQTFTIKEPIKGEAVFLDMTNKILLRKEDSKNKTILKKVGESQPVETIDETFWILEDGKQYQIINDDENITGFHIHDTLRSYPVESIFPASGLTKKLVAYYNTFLVNMIIRNNSSQTFNGSSIKITHENGLGFPSPTDLSVGANSTSLTYLYSGSLRGSDAYGKINIAVDLPNSTIEVPGDPLTLIGNPVTLSLSPRQTTIPSMTVNVNRIGWKNSNLNVGMSDTTVLNDLVIPDDATFEITSRYEGISAINPSSGRGSQTIRFTLLPTTVVRTLTVTATINHNGTTSTDSFTITQKANVHIVITDNRGSGSTLLGKITVSTRSQSLEVPYNYVSGIYEGYFTISPGTYTFIPNHLTEYPIPDIYFHPISVHQTITDELGDTIYFSIRTVQIG